MTMTDPIGDMLTRMRNAQHGRRTECQFRWSKISHGICELMKKHGYLATVEITGETPHQSITVTFNTDRAPLQLKRISTPGGRRYVGFDGMRKLLHGATMAIISTSQGLLTDKDARKMKAGGEVLCTIS